MICMSVVLKPKLLVLNTQYVTVKKNNEEDLEEEKIKPEKGRRSYENGWARAVEWIKRTSEGILKFGEFLKHRVERT